MYVCNYLYTLLSCTDIPLSSLVHKRVEVKRRDKLRDHASFKLKSWSYNRYVRYTELIRHQRGQVEAAVTHVKTTRLACSLKLWGAYFKRRIVLVSHYRSAVFMYSTRTLRAALLLWSGRTREKRRRWYNNIGQSVRFWRIWRVAKGWLMLRSLVEQRRATREQEVGDGRRDRLSYVTNRPVPIPHMSSTDKGDIRSMTSTTLSETNTGKYYNSQRLSELLTVTHRDSLQPRMATDTHTDPSHTVGNRSGDHLSGRVSKDAYLQPKPLPEYIRKLRVFSPLTDTSATSRLNTTNATPIANAASIPTYQPLTHYPPPVPYTNTYSHTISSVSTLSTHHLSRMPPRALNIPTLNHLPTPISTTTTNTIYTQPILPAQTSLPLMTSEGVAVTGEGRSDLSKLKLARDIILFVMDMQAKLGLPLDNI